MSLHRRAANIQTNHDLMTHDITSVCVWGSESVANTINKDGFFCHLDGAVLSLSSLLSPHVSLWAQDKVRHLLLY